LNLLSVVKSRTDYRLIPEAAMMNTDENQNAQSQPQLRFKGFNGPWEQRQLRELGIFAKGEGFSNGDVRKQGKGIVMYGQMYTHYRLVIDSPLSFVDSMSSGFTADNGDVIIPASGETAEDIAVASVIRDPGILLGGDLNVVRLTDKQIYPEFLAASISHGRNKRRLASLAQGKTIVHLHNSDIKGLPLSYPSLQEQKRIVGLIQTLDFLIVAAKRKYDLLKRQKQAYLQQMFPQKGERQPKLRFRGFTDPWEQRQLGKLAAITMGQSPSSKNYTVNPADHILVQGNADIENGWVSPRRWTTEVTKTASPGDLIMSVRAPVGAMAKTAYDVVLGRGVAGIKGDEFLYQLLCSLDSSGYWSRVSSGSTFDAISGQELSHTPVTIPSSEEERKYIGQFFQALDSTLNAAKNKVEALQRLKQGYMQQMFV
jgi:type I restriction enzyme S subunit